MSKKIVGITSCPTGIAHTFMAAEGLQKGAEALGYTAKVETQGSVGAENTLSAQDIRDADLVIIAADTKVDLSRFAGKKVYMSSTKAAINDGAGLVRTALANASVQAADLVDAAKAGKAAANANVGGIYKHLLTGVSYMIPFVVAGGLLIALAFAFRGIYSYDAALGIDGSAIEPNWWTNLWAFIFVGLGKAGFGLMVPILSGYIAFSIADRPGLAPGMIAGVVAGAIGSGFLGGIVGGLIAGYSVDWLNKNINLPKAMKGLMPVLILPVLGTLIAGLLLYFVVGQPVAWVNQALAGWLTSLGAGSKVILGIVLGLMMAFDMGGPVNKAAYVFATGTLANNEPSAVMAAVMAAGMTPPLGIAVATWLFKNRFNAEEREAGNAAAVLGLSFITEGAIPFAAKDPLKVIPSIMAGSAVASVLSMLFNVTLRVPHGGFWVLPIPSVLNGFGGLVMYIIAIAAGTAVTAALLGSLKKPISE